jgi:hypothetical protein
MRLFACRSRATNKTRPLNLSITDFAEFQRKLKAEFATAEVQFALDGTSLDITNADDLQMVVEELESGSSAIKLEVLDDSMPSPPPPAAAAVPEAQRTPPFVQTTVRVHTFYFVRCSSISRS